jgi:hypothetical protein
VNKNNGGLARHESRDYTSWFKFGKEMMIEYIDTLFLTRRTK